jgi:hypothetical protein
MGQIRPTFLSMNSTHAINHSYSILSVEPIFGAVRACLLFLILLCAIPENVPASVIYSSISRDSLTVGDRIQLSVSLVVPKGAQVFPPPVEQGLGKLVVKDWHSEKSEKPAADSFTFRYLLTAYDVEPCTLSALPFAVSAGNKTDTLLSQVFFIRMGSVIPPTGQGETLDIKDVKPLEKAGKPSLAWVWILLALALGGISAWFLKKFLDSRKKAKPEPPPIPPYEEALERIKTLEARQYLAKGMVREHVFELSDIFKRYIGRRFECNAAEFTTEEMTGWVRMSLLDRPVRNRADWFFTATDPVKFAKMIPDNDILTRFLAEVKLFLEETRPVPQAAVQSPAVPETGAKAATP